MYVCMYVCVCVKLIHKIERIYLCVCVYPKQTNF